MKVDSPNGSNVLESIVSNDICIGCGMCAGILPDVLSMYTDEYGAYKPQLIAETDRDWGGLSLQVCPFADNGENEDTIAEKLFGCRAGMNHSSETGYYSQCFAGHVADEQSRLGSTSGGIITWLARKMLSDGMVDYVACVGHSDKRDRLFDFRLINDVSDLKECRKSKYYPVEVSEVIEQIKKTEGKVLFIGLPCFVKAMRLAMQADPVLNDRVVNIIGLVCGHLKTKKYAAYLSRSCGVHENDVIAVDFRKKVEGCPASKYAFEVTFVENGRETSRQIMMEDVFAGSWSNNLFMLKACEYCDDVFAETADVTVGDAWLANYVKDYRGTSIVVCRDSRLLQILEEGNRSGDLHLDNLTIDEVIASQAGGLRQRRTGLEYRLHLSEKKALVHPAKRVRANSKAGSMFYRLLQRLRIKTRTLSHEAFLEQQSCPGLDVFIRRLQPWIRVGVILNLIRHGMTGLKNRTLRILRII